MSAGAVREIEVSPLDRVAPRKSRRHGVVVGINRYADERLNLRCAVADAKAIRDVMVDPQCGCFPEENVQMLLDDRATKEGVWRALARLRRDVGEEDMVWIYYAGHAAVQEDVAYWVTHDADVDDLFATALDSRQISTALTRLPARCVLMILDCCHAAATALQKNPTRAVVTGKDLLDRFDGHATVTIAASDGKQSSIELSDLGHGAFTYYLAKGLRGEGDTDQDGVVTADELWDYLRGKVREASSRAGNLQTPMLLGEMTHDVALTLNPSAAARGDRLSQRLSELMGPRPDQLSAEEGQYCTEILRRGPRTDRERALIDALDMVAGERLPPVMFQSMVRGEMIHAGRLPGRLAAAVAPAPLDDEAAGHAPGTEPAIAKAPGPVIATTAVPPLVPPIVQGVPPAIAQAERARDVALVAAARGFIANDQYHLAAAILLEVGEPGRVPGFHAAAVETRRGLRIRRIWDLGARPLRAFALHPEEEWSIMSTPEGVLGASLPGGSARLMEDRRGVIALGFSADGRTSWTATHDEVQTRCGDTERTFAAGGLTAAGISADGGLLAIATDNTLRIIAAQDNKEKLLSRHPPPISGVSFSPDGKGLFTVAGGAVHVWSGDQDRILPIRGRARFAVWSPDGKRIFVAPEDARSVLAHIFRFGGTPVEIPQPAGTASVSSAAFGPCGRRIVMTVEGSGDLLFWDGHEISSLRGDTAPLVWAGFIAKGKRILTVSEDGIAREWLLEAWSPSISLGQGSAATFSGDGARVLVSAGRMARIHAADGGGEAVPLMGLTADLRSAAWSPDGKLAVTAAADGSVRLHRTDGFGRPALLTRHLGGSADAAMFFADGRRVLTVSSTDGTAFVHEVPDEDGQVKKPLALGGAAAPIRRAVPSADAECVIAAGDGKLYVFRLDRPAQPVILPGPAEKIIALDVSFDRRRILSVSESGKTHLYSRESAEPFVLDGPKALFAAFSPDGERIAIAAADGSIHVRDAALTAPAVILLAPQGRPVTSASVMFTRDGRYLLVTRTEQIEGKGFGDSSTWRGSWSLLGADGKEEPCELSACESSVEHAAPAQISPDGERIVTVFGGEVLVWNAITAQAMFEELRRVGCDSLPVELRREHLGETAAEARGRYDAELRARPMLD